MKAETARVHVRVEVDIAEFIEQTAKRQGLTKSEVVTELLASEMKRKEG